MPQPSGSTSGPEGWMILRPSIRTSILPWPPFLTLLEEEFQESQMFQRVVNFRLRPTTHTTIRPASLSVRRLSIGGGALHHTLDSSRIGRRSRESSSYLLEDFKAKDPKMYALITD